MIRALHRGPRFAVRASLASFSCVLALLLAPASRSQGTALQLGPGQAKIDFSLGSTLHTVHGTFTLKNSKLQFDPANGKISGAVVVDATSGASGNSGRDARMHREILESAKFPEIIFVPTQIEGSVAANGVSKVEVSGKFRLHGQEHDVTLPVEVVADGQKLLVAIHFTIPYVEWGLKSPSNFFLRASDTVVIDVHATAQIENATAAH